MSAVGARTGSKLDAVLEDWSAVEEDAAFSGLLIGNGASRAVWEGFGYESLLRIAREENRLTRLGDSEYALFGALSTANFEVVLSALATSGVVSENFGLDGAALRRAHKRVQESLVEAVKSKHIPWGVLPDSTLAATKAHFRQYRRVYSTNYDLLAYWAAMHQGPAGFKDYFWGESFAIADTEVWDSSTMMLYLHGGLHLRRNAQGRVFKLASREGGNLLDQFGEYREQQSPLFVAEGSSADKLRVIFSSEYLAFVYTQLTRHSGPLCIFGHSLGESDRHIVDAIRLARVPVLAVSVLPGPADEIVRSKARLIAHFPDAQLRFFDSSTHPLGNAAFRVKPT